MKKIISLMLVCMLITTSSFAGTFTKTSNGSSVSINVDQGKTILIKAREIFGKIFTGWTITGASVTDASQKEQTITMGSGNVTAIANYATPYTVTVEQKANGVISPGTVTVAEGSSQTFTITPNTGHTISDVLVDGVSVKSSLVSGSGDTKTYTMNVNGNKTITALYNSDGSSQNVSTIVPTISIASKTTSSITVTTVSTAPNGGNLTYKLYANEVLKATSSATASGTSVSLTASDLYEFTNYSLYIVAFKDGTELGKSEIVSTYTKCYGGTTTNSVMTCLGTKAPYVTNWNGQTITEDCPIHSGCKVTITETKLSGSNNSAVTLGRVTGSDHCIHGCTSEHD